MEGLAAQAFIFINVALAGLLGGLIGLEREISRKPAGLRTHITVAMAACLIINLGTLVVDNYSDFVGQNLNTDPIRLFEAIIVGISFIGGGLIIKDNKSGNVENLTTAGSILLTATIGISIALHQYYLAAGIVILDLIVMSLLKKAEKRFMKEYFRNFD